MLNTLAHLGHDHTEELLTLDHCMPIIISAGIVIAILAGVIVYLLSTWQPKKRTVQGKTKRSK
jgi:hypothetical protein